MDSPYCSWKKPLNANSIVLLSQSKPFSVLSLGKSHGLNTTYDLLNLPLSPSHINLLSLGWFQLVGISFSPSSWQGSSPPSGPCIYWHTCPSPSVEEDASAFPQFLEAISISSLHLSLCALCSTFNNFVLATLWRIALWLLQPLCWQEVPVSFSPPPTGPLTNSSKWEFERPTSLSQIRTTLRQGLQSRVPMKILAEASLCIAVPELTLSLGFLPFSVLLSQPLPISDKSLVEETVSRGLPLGNPI